MVASQGEGEARAAALEALCRTYWYPLYAYVRQRGQTPEDAQDLTQEFFARLLQKEWLAELDPSPQAGGFRSFLLTALNRFLLNEHDRKTAAKRGGGCEFLSLDHELAEGRFSSEPKTEDSLEKGFDRRWALALLDAALTRLSKETSAAGRVRSFKLLSPFLSRDAEPGEYANIAKELGMTLGALGVAVHRLRQRYGEIVREEVAMTMASAADVDQEIRYLFAAVGS
jgi:RNA polymerase sigma-70 factor (ECF subfamily)